MMDIIRRFITLVTTVTILASSTNVLHANDDDVCCPEEYCGYAFENCSTAPCISPTLVLGTVALVAVIAVVVHNRKHHSGDSSYSYNGHYH